MRQTHIVALLLALSLALPAAPGGYALRTDGGAVCIFDAGTGRLLARTDTPVASLRKADRAQLAAGLFFDSLPALTQACEDFCS